MNKSQRNYSATELECWALIAAARKFDVYLKAARKIYFITDHNPLVWLRRQQDPRAKFARWIQEIEGLDYEIKYTKGSENCVADFLSRLDSEIDPKINDESEHFERFVYHVSSTSPDLLAFIKDEQSHDKSITYAYDQTLRTGRVIAGRFRHQQLAISDGLLMRHGRILIPEKARSAMITHIHNQAHPGIKRTTFLVKEQFSWDGMTGHIKGFCKRCRICQLNKAGIFCIVYRGRSENLRGR